MNHRLLAVLGTGLLAARLGAADPDPLHPQTLCGAWVDDYAEYIVMAQDEGIDDPEDYEELIPCIELCADGAMVIRQSTFGDQDCRVSVERWEVRGDTLRQLGDGGQGFVWSLHVDDSELSLLSTTGKARRLLRVDSAPDTTGCRRDIHLRREWF